MIKGRLLILGCIVSVSLIVSGCATEAITQTPFITTSPTATVETVATETLVPTASFPPTPSPIPTEAPSIPCMIVFDSNRDGNHEIYRMAPDGSQTINLTNHPAYDVEPTWSPDGSKIVFVSNRPNPGQEGGNYLHVMDADGSNVRQLTYENESSKPDWSNDGRVITYSNQGDIYIIKADGSGQSVNLTNSPEWDEQPTWSPDGTKIAWLSGENGHWNIFVMSPDGSNHLKLTDNGKAYDVFWTIDGEIFSHWEHPDGVCTKCVMQADGSNARDAGGKGEIQRYLPFKTLNGDRVECISGDINTGNEEIYLVGEIFPDIFFNLTNNPGHDRHPDWPANCLAGFEESNPEESTIPETGLIDPQSELVLGYAGDDPLQWQRKNNFQKACNELGIQCVYGEIPELLEENISAIVLNSSPERIGEADSAIRTAVEKGVPIFVLDAEIDMDGVYSITVDHSEMIGVTLNALLKDSGGSGEFAYFDFDQSQNDAKFIQGFLEKEYPKIKVVTSDTERYNFDEDDFIFNDLVTDYPSLKAVWTNAGYTNAVFGIVNNIQDPQKYPMLNCEPNKTGFYIWKDRITEHPDFKCVAVSNPPGIAYDAVYTAYYLMNGEKINESALEGMYGNAFIVDFPVITNENLLKELEIINFENDQFFADKLISPEEIKGKWFR